jgi:hypothetical protein
MVDCPKCTFLFAPVTDDLIRPDRSAIPTDGRRVEDDSVPSVVPASAWSVLREMIGRYPLALPLLAVAATASATGLIIACIRFGPALVTPISADGQVGAEQAARARDVEAKAAADRAAADRAAAAKAESARKQQAEYAAFQMAMATWIKDVRSVTLLLRSAPAPPIMHSRIREAADKLAEAGRVASTHVVNTPDGPTPKQDDVIGTIFAKAQRIQRALAYSEVLAERHMSAMRAGLFQMLGPSGELLSMVGRMYDAILDLFEDLMKEPDLPTMAKVNSAIDRMNQIADALGKAIE